MPAPEKLQFQVKAVAGFVVVVRAATLISASQIE
jgi:hypothetical protein